MKARAAALAVLILTFAASSATPAPAVHREVLPNGIVLLVAERPAVPIVALRVSMQVGAVSEPADLAGLANLTGTLLTRGTAKRTGQQLDSAIEFVGGRIEAGAGRDGLVAWLSVLKRDLTLGLDLLGEVVLTPAFPEAEVKRKAAQIQASLQRLEENPGAVASRALAGLVFPGHPYGRPVEGTRESVGRLTRDDVVRFYGQHARRTPRSSRWSGRSPSTRRGARSWLASAPGHGRRRLPLRCRSPRPARRHGPRPSSAS